MRKKDLPPRSIPWRERPFLTTGEAIELIPCSMSTLYALVDQGKLRLFKIGRTSVIETKGILDMHASLPEGRLSGVGRYGLRHRDAASETEPGHAV